MFYSALVGIIGNADDVIDLAGRAGFASIQVENIKPRVDCSFCPDGIGEYGVFPLYLLNVSSLASGWECHTGGTPM